MYVVFDIGGTNTRVASSNDLHTLGEPIKFKTPHTFEEGIAACITAAQTLANGARIRRIAGGIRGPLNHEKTSIISETVLCDWVGRPIVDRLSSALGAPVHLENDTAMVGLGEAHFGAGKGYPILAYHTVSTGVGGVRIVDGKVDVSSIGFEPGHQELDIDRSVLGQTIPHTLQNLISGSALEKRTGKKPYAIDQSDPVWDELARYLAHGLRNTIMYWSPDAIVLGGSMIVGEPRILLADIQKHTKAVLGDIVPCPPILDATLGDNGGLFGGLVRIAQVEGGIVK